MSKIQKVDVNFYSADELVEWISNDECKKRVDRLIQSEEKLFNYFLQAFYYQVMQYENKYEKFLIEYLPKKNQVRLDRKYENREPNTLTEYRGEFITPSKEDIEKDRSIAIELIKELQSPFKSGQPIE